MDPTTTEILSTLNVLGSKILELEIVKNEKKELEREREELRAEIRKLKERIEDLQPRADRHW
jgi:cell division protein FtsB